jgi:hypothetical protein
MGYGVPKPKVPNSQSGAKAQSPKPKDRLRLRLRFRFQFQVLQALQVPSASASARRRRSKPRSWHIEPRMLLHCYMLHGCMDAWMHVARCTLHVILHVAPALQLAATATVTGGGLYPIPWGAARWAPPRSQVPSDVIKSQKSTCTCTTCNCNCNSLGSRLAAGGWRLVAGSGSGSVGSLAHPRATPRLGSAAVSCPYVPCAMVLAPRREAAAARPSIGGQSPPPAPRASSRGVLPGRFFCAPAVPFRAHGWAAGGSASWIRTRLLSPGPHHPCGGPHHPCSVSTAAGSGLRLPSGPGRRECLFAQGAGASFASCHFGSVSVHLDLLLKLPLLY